MSSDTSGPAAGRVTKPKTLTLSRRLLRIDTTISVPAGTRTNGRTSRTSISRFIFITASTAPGLAPARKKALAEAAREGGLDF